VLREWDGRGANDLDLRTEMLTLFRAERQARRTRTPAPAPRESVPVGV
jgi:hypothetical protein